MKDRCGDKILDRNCENERVSLPDFRRFDRSIGHWQRVSAYRGYHGQNANNNGGEKDKNSSQTKTIKIVKIINCFSIQLTYIILFLIF